ncbi:MAG: hypothetical protein ABW208_24900 [Pyrinomonadaceae bacterium]
MATFLRQTLLPLALACLCVAAAPVRECRAQEQEPAAEPSNPLGGTRRKIDEYGKIGHCDETARLDNFAIELQNEPASKGYLLVYVGKNDLPSWTDGILQRAAHYLVDSRGLDAERVKVINGGYRESRAIELWVVPENFPPPEPSNTVEFKLDRTKAYQWDEDNFNVAFDPDDTEEAETDGAEEAVAEEAVGEAVAAAAPAESEAADAVEEEPEAESAEQAERRREEEKYAIEVVARGVIEDEPDDDDSGAEQAEPGNAAAAVATEGATEEDAAVEPEGPPTVGEITISLWWNVEPLAGELKSAPDSRVCLIYYWGVKSATQERVKAMVEQAIAKTEAQLGIKRERIIAIDGGRSSDPGVELWVVPPGAELPKPKPGRKRNFGFYTMPGED